MAFPAPTLTDEGKKLQLRAIAGELLQFTKIKIGSGEILLSEDLTKRKGLVNEIHSFAINSAKRIEDSVELKASFDNSEIKETFEFREIGVFAKCEGDAEEQLYCYTNCGEKAETIEGTSVDYVEKTINVLVSVSNEANVTIIIQPERYVLYDEYQKDIKFLKEMSALGITLPLDPRTNNEDYLIDSNKYSIEETLCCLGFSNSEHFFAALNPEILQRVYVDKNISSTEYNLSTHFKAKKDCKIEISVNIHFKQSCEPNDIKQFGIYIAKNTVESATENDILDAYVENYFTAQKAGISTNMICVNMNLPSCTFDLKKDESFSIWVPKWATEGLRYAWGDRGKYNHGFLNIKILDYQN